jgi:cell division protein FtsQ
LDGGGRELLSIGLFARHKDASEASSNAGHPVAARRVLPYVFRRPARLFNRLLAGNANISRRGWLILALTMTMIAMGGVLANSRQGNSVVANLSATMGFTVNQVLVDGIEELSEAEIVSRLDIGGSNSLFSFDIKSARRELQKLAWVKQAVVAKSYPNRLIVTISERQPFAIWQNNNVLALVERGGRAITVISKERLDESFSHLPLLVGDGANTDGAQILYLTGKIAALEGRIKAFARIAGRRWDLHLDNGIIVRLPDNDPVAALGKLARLDGQHDLLTLDLQVVDLRLPDRLVVALGKGASKKPATENVNSGSEKSTPINMIPVNRPAHREGQT